MVCQEPQRSELAERYLNGQLDPATQEQLELHLLDCPICQQTVELLQTVRDELRARAHETRAYSSAPRGGLRWSWVAVATLVVIAPAGVLQLGKLRHTTTQVARNSTPEKGLDPSSSRNKSGQEVKSNPANAAGADSTDDSVRGVGSTASQPPDYAVESAHAAQKPSRSVTPTSENNDQSDARKEVAAAGHRESSSQPSAPGAPAEAPVENPVAAIAVKEGPPATPMSGEVAKLATVRPLPYTGAASSQPVSGGCARVQLPTASGIFGNGGTSAKSGESRFSTAQDYFCDGMTAYADQDYENASNLLAKAVRLEPEFSEANLYLGISRLLQAKTADAVTALQSAVKEEKPGSAQAAHFYLGKTYLQLGKLGGRNPVSSSRINSSPPGR